MGTAARSKPLAPCEQMQEFRGRVRPEESRNASYLPVHTGASHATGLAGSPPAASPPPAFHTRIKK